MTFIVDSAAAGDPAQQAVLARGDTAIYERDPAHLERCWASAWANSVR